MKNGTTRVVGIGASAGGLEALEHFFSHVPVASGLAYVVVQHLDPTHRAMLTELLQRFTTMRVCEVADYMRVEPDTVYVIPPNSELTLAGGLLRLERPLQPRGKRLPIDALFLSLAKEQREHAIGVVLSGMGADGTLGLLAIKRQRGLTLAQSPASAQFDSMPQSAITAGYVDIVAPPAELPVRILRIAAPPPVRATETPPAEARDDQAAGSLKSILELLHSHSKHDLSLYKTSTLLRRIERRMSVHGLPTMAAYQRFLRENPAELDLMFREMLIGVTTFFRDPHVWQELQHKVLPGLQAAHRVGPLRAWVVGCSTGEEAYSLAMAFHEIAEVQPDMVSRTLQIFATDLSADAIDFARRGVYSQEIVADMSPERLSRFFIPQGAGYAVKKNIREMVLFAKHDVIIDPPFTRLDIVSCRNLLIYFNATLQRRLLPLFHYCLRPGGVLLLGGSETTGSTGAAFVVLDSKSRLYRRSGRAPAAGAFDFPVALRRTPRNPPQESTLSKPPAQLSNLQSQADQVILQEFSPAAVLVNEQGDIIYISGHTGRYLEPAAGKANWNIYVMARPGIRTQLSAALRQAAQEAKPVELRGLKVEGGSAIPVDVTVKPMGEPNALEGLVMIIFRDAVVPPAARRPRKRAVDATDPVVAAELQRSQEEIRALRQETRASQEQLQAANEELQSTNEELQSANEELTTSKEEAQSMNEELQTVNSELRARLDDLALAQSDMQNLLNSTEIATLFLDNDLNVRRFTDQATRVIHLRDGDVGRPLSDLASTLNYPELGADAKETLRTLVIAEREVATTDGKWFSIRILPYRTVSNVIQGVVITFVDITTAK